MAAKSDNQSLDFTGTGAFFLQKFFPLPEALEGERSLPPLRELAKALESNGAVLDFSKTKGASKEGVYALAGLLNAILKQGVAIPLEGTAKLRQALDSVLVSKAPVLPFWELAFALYRQANDKERFDALAKIFVQVFPKSSVPAFSLKEDEVSPVLNFPKLTLKVKK